MKLFYKPGHINSNPKNAYKLMQNIVTNGIKQKQSIDDISFYAELHAIGDSFTRQNQLTEMNKSSKRFAELLVSLGNGKLAGIIYSFLIKLNYNNPELVEQLATNGLAIAKRFNDPVHKMARAENLVKIYEKTQFGQTKHIQMLYTEKRALVQICKDYDKANNKFQTITRKMKPFENYEKMLSAIKIKIAELIMNDKPKDAIRELKEAKEIISKYGTGANLKKINNLLNKLEGNS